MARILETKSYILNHLYLRLSIAQLARRSFLSKVRFQDGFKLLFGYTIQDYIREARLQFGYFLLYHTDRPIKEVAHLCGYQYTKNFMGRIKAGFGRTAMDIRRTGSSI
jgi:AraC-like DNA-binding protein